MQDGNAVKKKEERNHICTPTEVVPVPCKDTEDAPQVGATSDSVPYKQKFGTFQLKSLIENYINK